MTTAPRPSREIDGKGRTVRELLAGRKYSIDYYQREYKWQQKQVAELIDDLAAKFLSYPDRRRGGGGGSRFGRRAAWFAGADERALGCGAIGKPEPDTSR